MHTTSLAALLKSPARRLPDRLSNDGWWLVEPHSGGGGKTSRAAVCETQMETPIDRPLETEPAHRE